MTLFQPATKKQARARIGMSGPAGSGKTMWSLQWATVLAEGGPIAVIDTERGSASLYADRFQFDVLQLQPPFHPDRLVEAINAATEGGYAVLIVDSLTHFWSGAGGVLEIVDEASTRFKGNSHAAWQVGTPIQQRMVDGLLGCGMHLIATMRSKTEWVMEQNSNGRVTPRKVGLAPQQRSDIEFEFTLFMEIEAGTHRATPTKTRYDGFRDKVFNPEESTSAAEQFRDWLVHGQMVISDLERDALQMRIGQLNKAQTVLLKSMWKEANWPKLTALTADSMDLVVKAIASVEAMAVSEPEQVEASEGG